MPSHSRHSILVPALVGFCTYTLVSKSCSFLAGQGPRVQGTAMRGFKEDFFAWKDTLTSDEKAMLLRQTKGEFDKKYRKTEEFDQDLPDEKVEALSKVMQKFYDSEEEDYIKQRDAKAPDYDRIAKKCAVKAYDWSLESSIIEVNRDAMRMEEAAHFRINDAKSRGETVPCGSPLKEIWKFKNDDEATHKNNLEVFTEFKEMCKKAGVACDASEVPPMGKAWEVTVPEYLMPQLMGANDMLNGLEKEGKLTKEELAETRVTVMTDLAEAYSGERKVLEGYAEDLKTIAKSQTYVEGKTRSMWAKELHEAIAKYNKENGLEAPPPLDDEYLAEMDKEPCDKPDSPNFKSPWKTASMLYKSEAIDSFGGKYLLGIYPTIEEARKVFADWNQEYEEERVRLKEQVMQWGKQEQARLDKDPEGQARMRKAVEDARR